MGLIKAAMGAAGGVMADQWKEFFYCDASGSAIHCLIKRSESAQGARSSNTNGKRQHHYQRFRNCSSKWTVYDDRRYRVKLWKFVQSQESIHMIHLPNQVFLPEI